MSTRRAEANADDLAQTNELPRAPRTPTLVGLPPVRAPMETMRALPDVSRASGGRARRKTPLPISEESSLHDESTPISSVRICPPRLRPSELADFSDTVVEPLPDMLDLFPPDAYSADPATSGASLDFAPTVADPNVAPLPADIARRPIPHPPELAPRISEERTAVMDIDALTRLKNATERAPQDEFTSPMVEVPALEPDVARAPAGLVVWPPTNPAVPNQVRSALQSWTKLTRRPVPTANMSWVRPATRAPQVHSSEEAVVGVRFTRLLGYLIIGTLIAIALVQMMNKASF